MKTSAILTALALGALTAQVGATPSGPSKAQVAQNNADVALVRKDEKRPVIFCQNYLSTKKKTTPIKDLPVARLSKACTTITNSQKAALKTSSSKAAAKKSSSAAAAAAKSSSSSAAAARISSSSQAAAKASSSSAAAAKKLSSSSAAAAAHKTTAAPKTTTPNAGKTSATSVKSSSTASSSSVNEVPSGKGIPVVTVLPAGNATATRGYSSSSARSNTTSTRTSLSTSASATPSHVPVCIPCDDGTTMIGYGLTVTNPANNAGGYLLVPNGQQSTFDIPVGKANNNYSPMAFNVTGDELTFGTLVMALDSTGQIEMTGLNATRSPLHWDLNYDDCSASFSVTNASGTYDSWYLQGSSGNYNLVVGNEAESANATQPVYIDLAPICMISNGTTSG